MLQNSLCAEKGGQTCPAEIFRSCLLQCTGCYGNELSAASVLGQSRVIIPFNYLLWQPGIPVSSGNNDLFLWYLLWEVARLLSFCQLYPLPQCVSYSGMTFYFWKNSKAFWDNNQLQTTKLLVVSEVHYHLVISGVYPGSLKNATALLRTSPFPAFLCLSLEMAVCPWVTEIRVSGLVPLVIHQLAIRCMDLAVTTQVKYSCYWMV